MLPCLQNRNNSPPAANSVPIRYNGVTTSNLYRPEEEEAPAGALLGRRSRRYVPWVLLDNSDFKLLEIEADEGLVVALLLSPVFA